MNDPVPFLCPHKLFSGPRRIVGLAAVCFDTLTKKQQIMTSKKISIKWKWGKKIRWDESRRCHQSAKDLTEMCLLNLARETRSWLWNRTSTRPASKRWKPLREKRPRSGPASSQTKAAGADDVTLTTKSQGWRCVPAKGPSTPAICGQQQDSHHLETQGQSYGAGGPGRGSAGGAIPLESAASVTRKEVIVGNPFPVACVRPSVR